MKIRLAILLIIMVLTAFAQGQTRIENPKRPSAINAGRVVDLVEVLRIEDDGATAIFGNSQELSLGKDGSLFFIDFAEGGRLYRYSPNGKLIFKILRSGQGPGECRYPINYFLADDIIRVMAFNPPKILDFGPDGRYLREVSVKEDTHGVWFLTAAEGKIYTIRNELFGFQPFRQNQEGVFVIPNSVYEISPDFKQWRKIYEFPVRNTIKRRRGAIRLDMIDAAIQGPILHIVHTAEYQIESLDLRTGKIVRIFRRVYERQRLKPEKVGSDPETKGFDKPSDPFYFDIFEIHAVGNNLWVFTSTEREGGTERLVDVFDAGGKFIDSFFLHFASNKQRHRYGVSLVTGDGYIFVPEQDEEGLVSIGKYKIPDVHMAPMIIRTPVKIDWPSAHWGL